ncbi:MAG: hypothetical protein ABW049_06860 [Spongiibacteraceae bacterium]
MQSVHRCRRPWWLLLALALFLAGQTLAAAHWHDSSQDADDDCALCVYSATATAAVAAAGWHIPVVIAAAIGFSLFTSVRLVAVRFCDPRAPPVSQH